MLYYVYKHIVMLPFKFTIKVSHINFMQVIIIVIEV